MLIKPPRQNVFLIVFQVASLQGKFQQSHHSLLQSRHIYVSWTELCCQKSNSSDVKACYI